jgi:hypothetical protein
VNSIGSARVWLLVFVAIAASAGLVACGGGGANQEELAKAAHKGAAHRAEQERLRKLEKELKEVHNGGAGTNLGVPNQAPTTTSAPAETNSNCGNGLTVGPDTTCEFAENVRTEYEFEIGSGPGKITAYSPANETVYEMYCTAGSPHECTGAIDASVYFP